MNGIWINNMYKKDEEAKRENLEKHNRSTYDERVTSEKHLLLTSMKTSNGHLTPTTENLMYVLSELPPLTSCELLHTFGIPTKGQTKHQRELYKLLLPLIKKHAELLDIPTGSGKRV